MAEALTIEQLSHELAQFTGTTVWRRNPLYGGMLYTDGIAYMAKRAGAYWLLDCIGIRVFHEVKHSAPYIIRFTSNEGKGTLSVREMDSKEPCLVYPIDYTDFPQGSIEMYLMDGVLLLPSEY